ncbi:cupin domain-containing protein [Cyanobium sp. ATX-6F1]|uniref:cupin domain-containing protein n=1 Tax=Cyanobium sp. ATX-6F1 TaxID=3137388 RepID=UPI0039BE5B48
MCCRQTLCSRWHRVQQAEESWHHAGGSPLRLWRLAPEGARSRPCGWGPWIHLAPSRGRCSAFPRLVAGGPE